MIVIKPALYDFRRYIYVEYETHLKRRNMQSALTHFPFFIKNKIIIIILNKMHLTDKDSRFLKEVSV